MVGCFKNKKTVGISFHYIIHGERIGGFNSLLAPSSFINSCFTGSKFKFLPVRKAITPMLTSVQDLWPFFSFKANSFLLVTASEKLVTCGTGSRSEEHTSELQSRP